MMKIKSVRIPVAANLTNSKGCKRHENLRGQSQRKQTDFWHNAKSKDQIMKGDQGVHLVDSHY